MAVLSPPVASPGLAAPPPVPTGLPNPGSIALRSERSAFAEATPARGVCATCRGPVIVRARYDDYWNTPLTLAPLRVTDANGIVFDGDIRTQGLMSFGTRDGEVDVARLAALEPELGFVRAADAQRGPLMVELVADAAAARSAADLERQILADLRALARDMQTAIQPWVLDWERRGVRGAFLTFLGGVRDGVVDWWEGEGEFWSSIGDWFSNLPDMASDAWDDLTEAARTLWNNREALLNLLRDLATGEVNGFERGLEALRAVFDFVIDGVHDMRVLMDDVLQRSREWAQGMNELARRSRVLQVLGATALGVLAMIPPNFWAEVAGKAMGFLIPEAIIAILLLILAAFTAGTGAGFLATRLANFARVIRNRLATLGQAGSYFVRVLDALGDLWRRIARLIENLMASRRERRAGTTDVEIPVVRSSRPRGRRTAIPPDADDATRRSLMRENDSADILAREGFDVEQNPITDGPLNPDYRINDNIYDNYAPSTDNPRNIWSEVKKKVDRGQANRIVLNTSDSAVDMDLLRRQFQDWPIEGLEDIKIISSGGYEGSL